MTKDTRDLSTLPFDEFEYKIPMDYDKLLHVYYWAKDVGIQYKAWYQWPEPGVPVHYFCTNDPEAAMLFKLRWK
jgi:hypothetical protein